MGTVIYGFVNRYHTFSQVHGCKACLHGRRQSISNKAADGAKLIGQCFLTVFLLVHRVVIFFGTLLQCYEASLPPITTVRAVSTKMVNIIYILSIWLISRAGLELVSPQTTQIIFDAVVIFVVPSSSPTLSIIANYSSDDNELRSLWWTNNSGKPL